MVKKVIYFINPIYLWMYRLQIESDGSVSDDYLIANEVLKNLESFLSEDSLILLNQQGNDWVWDDKIESLQDYDASDAFDLLNRSLDLYKKSSSIFGKDLFLAVFVPSFSFGVLGASYFIPKEITSGLIALNALLLAYYVKRCFGIQRAKKEFEKMAEGLPDFSESSLRKVLMPVEENEQDFRNLRDKVRVVSSLEH
ncbi:MAG: hypothetical protein GOU97_02830 [Nanoarchaeota archaeon]|nr:hypothetical protein [Nanoarchaeota archaeon]